MPGHSFRIREGVQFDVQTVWPLLAGVIPNDPSVAPPFVDPRESLENPVPEMMTYQFFRLLVQ